jgi:isopentenyl-diphosphate delta-isomerase
MKMKKANSILDRKRDHIDINLNKDVSSLLSNGFERYRLIHCALPELNYSEVDLSTTLFNIKLGNPLLISSMTGGTEKATGINNRLAKIAQEYKLAMGVGSQRIGIEDESVMDSFNVRKIAPDILLFANIGAVQLNYSFSVSQCRKAVDAIRANALILHLNPMQEVLMTDGNTNFSGLLTKIESVCKKLGKPVVAKEVGWGISSEVAKKLINAGVSAIDVAGAGGTSWAEVERYRTQDQVKKLIAAGFRGWGIPTAESLTAILGRIPGSMIFATGGIKNGVDITKAIALGAALGGMAGPFLRAAENSEEELREFTRAVIEQIKIAMFSVGAKNLKDLRKQKITKLP